MFNFAWSEIALIGVVALVAIGPKDLPVAIKAISDTIKKLRRMAGEFQGHVDELIREADLGDVKSTFDDLRGMNVKNTLQRVIDPDRSVASAFTDPFAARSAAAAHNAAVMQKLEPAIEVPERPVLRPALVAARQNDGRPAFMPPDACPPLPSAPAPAFIPPSVVALSHG